MYQDLAPIPIPHRPWTLNGISKDMMVSHYENNYGGAVRTLNAVRKELAALEGGAPGYRIRALKREELSALNSVALHELYFGNLGGDGRVTEPVRAVLEEHFGSYAAWRREFVAAGQSLAGGSGWALLTYARRQKALWIQTATGPYPSGGGRDPGPRARHVRARVPHGLRRERRRLHRRLHAQRRLGRGRRADRRGPG
jgi:Fe-Mn family superoxide dismutase